MSDSMAQVKKDVETIVNEFQASNILKEDMLLVVGCSTSEVIGKTIGTYGSEDVAKVLFEGFSKLVKENHIHLVFQCCEHLNRALVLERDVAHKYHYEEVTVIPVKDAGGSMATYAYQHFEDPVVVEDVEAHLGIDIGDTLIGMHLKKVAVPLRFSINHIGNAHITIARTRPKLIGGERARYK